MIGKIEKIKSNTKRVRKKEMEYLKIHSTWKN